MNMLIIAGLIGSEAEAKKVEEIVKVRVYLNHIEEIVNGSK